MLQSLEFRKYLPPSEQLFPLFTISLQTIFLSPLRCRRIEPLPPPLRHHSPHSRSLPVAQNGDTALIEAAWNGRLDCVAELIAAGANCNVKGEVRCCRISHYCRRSTCAMSAPPKKKEEGMMGGEGYL